MFVKSAFRAFVGKNFSNAYSLFRSLRLEANPLFHWNSKITGYFKKHDVDSARKLFDEMPHKNVVTWNCMISGFIRNGMIREARQVFDSMPIKNVVSWTAMLSGYAKNGRLEEARALFDLVQRKNVACWNSMISGYVNCGRIEEGRALFDAMPVKNDVSWAMMIEGYFRYGTVNEAESLFNKASSKSLLLCNAMLAGYGGKGSVDKSYDLFMRMPERDVASWTCMITCFMGVGEVERGKRFFDEMPEKDTVAWTAVIKGYLDHKRIESAGELFDKMPHKDIVAWNSMLSGCVHNGKVEDAHDLFMKMLERNKDDITTARKFFEGMPMKDETSWNTLISGYQTEEALVLYVKMLSDGFKPDQSTLTSVISVCGILALQSWGKAMHVFVFKIGCENDNMVMSSMISMYSRCGFINDACLVFKTMHNHDTAAWNAMLVAQAHHYSAKEALNLFHCMTHAGCRPDHVTFLVLLTACSHSGLISDAWKYFKLMERWKLTPKPQHYACMVDLLGRSGLVAEAFELVNQLPVDLPVYAWETLLSACSIHANYDLGDLIAEKILGYQPCDVGMCVLQSNIYSARGMWKDAAHIRAKLKQNQLNKELGCSWIDINGSVSCFSYNDKSHIRAEDIYKELEGLSVLIEEVG
ncbi:UNVERIFIED_CONTAM: Pentatricopeptide repeat-containing protein, mitochondrial [Sesamum latifolium]|uniref:Pentatricopeptide repeat-containing protein, mitochondrial n=1 Tax=Sesamum latifolium TaxID=2727402 RepID=A0AAW2U268_9LAMI